MAAKRPTPAKAGAITRILKDAGMAHGEEHKASRGVVRGGWSTFTTGITSEQEMNRTRIWRSYLRQGRGGWEDRSEPTGYVHVYWQWARSRSSDTADRNARAVEHLTKAAEILRSKGYEVTENPNDHTGMSLTVCRMHEGEVVKW